MRIYLSYIISLLVAMLFLISGCAIGEDDPLEELFEGDGEQLFIAVGQDTTNNHAVFASENGDLWAGNMILTGSGGTLHSVAYGNSRFVTAGDSSSFFISEDGLLWPYEGNTGATIIYDIIYANELFVAAGQGGAVGSIYVSIDGIIWSGNVSFFTPDVLNGIAYGNDTFVAVGNNESVTLSTDGVLWTPNIGPPAGINNIYDIAYGSGKFVAVGSGGVVYISENGHAWTRIYTPGGFNLTAVAYGNRKFVAVTDVGPVLVSDDGYTWYRVPVGFVPMNGIGFCGGRFFALGSSSDMMVSTDGKAWSQVNVNDAQNLWGMVCGQK